MDKNVWVELPQRDKDMYSKVFRTLLNSTNIVRDKDENHKAMYNFINNSDQPFRKYLKEDLEYAGFNMTVNTDYKYIHIQDISDSVIKINKQNLNLIDSVSLCCLWLIYIEAINTNALKKTIVIELQDFFTKLNVFNISIPQFKTSFDKSFELFKKFNLIDYKGKPSGEGFYITIFPTIQFALDQDELKKFIEKKKQEYIDYSNKKKSIEYEKMNEEEDENDE